MLWKMFYPDFDINEEYYEYLRLGYKKNMKIWKLGDRVLKDNPTQQDIDELMALFAKDLLRGKVK